MTCSRLLLPSRFKKMRMNKILTVLMGVLLLDTAATAQVVISPQLPPAGISLKSQLWGVTLSNAGTTSLLVRLNLVMTDQASGQQVLSATTNPVLLPPGVKLLQHTDVAPVTYLVLNNVYNIDASPTGFLPVGTFNVCYNVLYKNPAAEQEESIAEECTAVEVEPLSPPYLSLPGDQSETDERHPLFVWIPPAPAAYFTSLSYEVKLTEVLPGQQGEDALLQNMPLLYRMGHTGISLQHPSSLPALDTGKTYAWQVSASNNGQLVARSEVWTFKVRGAVTTGAAPQGQTAYFKLHRESATAYFLSTGVLKFLYVNDAADTLALVKVYDVSGAERREVAAPQQIARLISGENYIDFELDNSRLVNGRMYEVLLTNSRQEIWRGRFRFNKND